MHKVRVFCILFFILSILAFQQGCAKKIESAMSSAGIEDSKAAGVALKQDKHAVTPGGKADKEAETKAIGEESIGKAASQGDTAREDKGSKPGETAKGGDLPSMEPAEKKPAVIRGGEVPESGGHRATPLLSEKDGREIQSPDKKNHVAKEEPESLPEAGKVPESGGHRATPLLSEKDGREIQSPDKENHTAKENTGPAPEPKHDGILTEVMKKDEETPAMVPEKEIMVAAKEEPGAALEGIRKGREDSGLKDMFFDFDSWIIKGDFIGTLEQDAKYLISNPGLKVQIEGHADERGTNEYNLALGERRAKSTRKFLVDMGVGPERISIISYGEERPFCREHGESCWTINRRGHFLIIGE
ncbi:MAG: OmpA family protein [Nitrospirota bacterium]